jgi:hypothetical protein
MIHEFIMQREKAFNAEDAEVAEKNILIILNSAIPATSALKSLK